MASARRHTEGVFEAGADIDVGSGEKKFRTSRDDGFPTASWAEFRERRRFFEMVRGRLRRRLEARRL